MRVVGLSLHLCFLGVGVGGSFFFTFCLGGGGGFTFISYFLFSYFLEGNFLFVFVLWWKFIYICLTFTHSFTQFFFVLWGGVSVGRCAFLVFGHKHVG